MIAALARQSSTASATSSGWISRPMGCRRSEADARAALERRQPIGRLIDPDEVADAVLLCLASAAITGQGINVDGGAVQS